MGLLSKIKDYFYTTNEDEAVADNSSNSEVEEQEGKKESRVRGEFYEDKFFEDQIVKNTIKEKLGDDGYFDDYYIGTILNVGKAGLERILTDCEEAFKHYSSGGKGIDGFCKNYSPHKKAEFYKECVLLCQQQLEECE